MPSRFVLLNKGGCQKTYDRVTTEGFVYWDDEDSSNKNTASGTLPDGTYNIDTRIQMCTYAESTGKIFN